MNTDGRISVEFHGVRGSTPCHGPDVSRYGGNTSCVGISAPGEEPLLFDLGTGLRLVGQQIAADQPFVGNVLLSHLHWDHVQGLPFFRPLLADGARMTIFAPVQDDGRHPGDVLLMTIRPPLFPVHLHEIKGTVAVHRAQPEFEIGGFKVRSAAVPHHGATNGYRVEWGGRSVAYVCDHQQPDDVREVAESVRELCDGVDLLIHDAQYHRDDFAGKADWGHSTSDYAVTVAAAVGARQLALFHHDPFHDDDTIDQMAADAAKAGAEHGIEVIAAAEGERIDLG